MSRPTSSLRPRTKFAPPHQPPQANKNTVSPFSKVRHPNLCVQAKKRTVTPLLKVSRLTRLRPHLNMQPPLHASYPDRAFTLDFCMRMELVNASLTAAHPLWRAGTTPTTLLMRRPIQKTTLRMMRWPSYQSFCTGHALCRAHSQVREEGQ
jgi:hypothetical protein